MFNLAQTALDQLVQDREYFNHRAAQSCNSIDQSRWESQYHRCDYRITRIQSRFIQS